MTIFGHVRYDLDMNIHRSNNIEETNSIAIGWLNDIIEKRKSGGSGVDGAFVVGLSGHLGAGKTAFTKCVAKELGIEDVITSPTFVIMKIYDTRNETFKKLIHIDAYRMEQRSELEALKFESVVSDPNSLVMIEWPENVGLSNDDLDQVIKFDIVQGTYTIGY